MKQRTTAILTFLLTTLPLRAHPGHGESHGWSLLHWLSEPQHFIPVLVGLVVATIGTIRVMRRRAEK